MPATSDDLELLLRRIIREEAGITPAVPAEKWRGGTLVLRPGTPGLQEKTWPIETFFHKVVMIRNRLRVLEQQINAAEFPEDEKVRLQGLPAVDGSYLIRITRAFREDGTEVGVPRPLVIAGGAPAGCAPDGVTLGPPR